MTQAFVGVSNDWKKGEKVSNDWKKREKSFQWLEKVRHKD